MRRAATTTAFGARFATVTPGKLGTVSSTLSDLYTARGALDMEGVFRVASACELLMHFGSSHGCVVPPREHAQESVHRLWHQVWMRRDDGGHPA